MITLIPSQIIGTERGLAFVDWHDPDTGEMRGELRTVERKIYASSAQAEQIREARVGNHLSLRDASRRLGISLVEMSGLERGSLTVSPTDLQVVLNAFSTGSGAAGP